MQARINYTIYRKKINSLGTFNLNKLIPMQFLR